MYSIFGDAELKSVPSAGSFCAVWIEWMWKLRVVEKLVQATGSVYQMSALMVDNCN